MDTDNIELTTNLIFKSNVYVVKERTIYLDSVFCSKIHNFKALEELKRRNDYYRLSTEQKKEFSDASLTCCMHGDKRDYVWGNIIDENGHKKNICKCTKTDCEHFAKCRPNVAPDKVEHYDKNKHIHLGMNYD